MPVTLNDNDTSLLREVAYRRTKPALLGTYWTLFGHELIVLDAAGYIDVTPAGEQHLRGLR